MIDIDRQNLSLFLGFTLSDIGYEIYNKLDKAGLPRSVLTK